MARLLRRAARRFARPRHVITDLGGEFTGAVFRDAVARLGASHRFASKDSLRATARLERFWRTIKEAARLRRLQLPLTLADLECRLELALLHYVVFRPHAGSAARRRSRSSSVESPPKLRPWSRRGVGPVN